MNNFVSTHWGTYKVSNNNDENLGYCVDCARGTYQNQTGQTSCYNCIEGRSSPKAWNITGCLDCSPGMYANTLGTTCKLCEKGKYIE